VRAEPTSVQSKFARSPEAKDYLAEVLPFAGNMQTY
jgi:hypothetical protein